MRPSKCAGDKERQREPPPHPVFSPPTTLGRLVLWASNNNQPETAEKTNHQYWRSASLTTLNISAITLQLTSSINNKTQRRYSQMFYKNLSSFIYNKLDTVQTAQWIIIFGISIAPFILISPFEGRRLFTWLITIWVPVGN